MVIGEYTGVCIERNQVVETTKILSDLEGLSSVCKPMLLTLCERNSEQSEWFFRLIGDRLLELEGCTLGCENGPMLVKGTYDDENTHLGVTMCHFCNFSFLYLSLKILKSHVMLLIKPECREMELGDRFFSYGFH